jgi:hypothetical protein
VLVDVILSVVNACLSQQIILASIVLEQQFRTFCSLRTTNFIFSYAH